MLEPNVTVIVERSLATFFTKSDPEHFVVLPPKIFERELVTERKDFFDPVAGVRSRAVTDSFALDLFRDVEPF